MTVEHLAMCRPHHPANDNYRLALLERLRESMAIRDSAVGEVINFVRQLNSGLEQLESRVPTIAASPPEGEAPDER